MLSGCPSEKTTWSVKHSGQKLPELKNMSKTNIGIYIPIATFVRPGRSINVKLTTAIIN
jgi:hypothetical protein